VVQTGRDASGFANGKEARGFDAYGKPRSANWMADAGPVGFSGNSIGWTQLGLQTTHRGFTQHEHLDDSQLIHMNGRLFDYRLGRFLGVDPIIQFPTNSQSFNPYAYLMNNPLAGTDPTGYYDACAAKGPAEGQVCDVTVKNKEPNSDNVSSATYTVVGTKDNVVVFTGDNGGGKPGGLKAAISRILQNIGAIDRRELEMPGVTVSTKAPKASEICGVGAGVPCLPSLPGEESVPSPPKSFGTKVSEFGDEIVNRILPAIPGEGQLAGGGLKFGAALFIRMGTAGELAAKAAINPKVYEQLGKQLSRDGAKSIFKALRSAEKALVDHQVKLEQILKDGGFPSQVQGTIRNVEGQIETLKKFILDNAL
jgi:RHS repeat-associated protein